MSQSQSPTIVFEGTDTLLLTSAVVAKLKSQLAGDEVTNLAVLTSYLSLLQRLMVVAQPLIDDELRAEADEEFAILIRKTEIAVKVISEMERRDTAAGPVPN